MSSTRQQTPPTRPSLKYLYPYRQTVIGFIAVAAIVALLVLLVQLLMLV